jgi:hypothetical protein
MLSFVLFFCAVHPRFGFTRHETTYTSSTSFIFIPKRVTTRYLLRGAKNSKNPTTMMMVVLVDKRSVNGIPPDSVRILVASSPKRAVSSTHSLATKQPTMTSRVLVTLLGLVVASEATTSRLAPNSCVSPLLLPRSGALLTRGGETQTEAEVKPKKRKSTATDKKVIAEAMKDKDSAQALGDAIR